MVRSSKPLHSFEQSLLLSAMFFDSKNVAELLKFLPDEQANRMSLAKDKFLSLPRNERMTQIVLEMRRLLLIDEYCIDWIHKSWIQDALSREPNYLKPLIEAALDMRLTKKTLMESNTSKIIPLSLIIRMFLEQLTTTPRKTAIYDPALIRLQSLKGVDQEEKIRKIGQSALHNLSSHVHKKRFLSFLKRRGLVISVNNIPALVETAMFKNDALRQFFLRELIAFERSFGLDGEAFAGLIIIALYLSNYKLQWQRGIVLSLEINLGRVIEAIILRISGRFVDEQHHNLLAHFIVRALDRT